MVSQAEVAISDTFKKRLKRFREERGQLSQAELAERAHISTVTISKLEQGKNLPTFEVLLALCAALNVSPNDLVGWTGGTLGEGDQLASERLAAALRKMPKAHGEAIIMLVEQLAKS